MIKNLIFKPFFVRGLFVLSVVCFIAMAAFLLSKGPQKPEFAYFLMLGLFMLVLGKRIQIT